MDYMTRRIERRFLEMSAAHKAVLLIGARQVGKTTMLLHLEEKRAQTGQNRTRTYVTLDNMMARDLAKNDPALFFRTYKPPVLIAEIQYVPELFEWIRDMCDESTGYGKFWLTSSLWDDKMKQATEVMGGRLGILEMYGLSRREVEGVDSLGSPGSMGSCDYSFPRALREKHQGADYSLEKLFEHIWRGGMPDAHYGSTKARAAYYDGYIDNLIIRDATYICGVTDALRFRKLVVAAAVNNGKKLNYKILAEAAGVSQPTAKEWLCMLEGLGIVHVLKPFHHDALKRLVKTAKLYFRDTGLSAYLAGWRTPEMLRKGEAGERYLMNHVVMELIKNYATGGMGVELTFYRNAKAKEIDLILLEDQTIHPFEVRLSDKPDVKDLRKFNVLDKAGIRRGRGGIICPRPRMERIHGENYFIPCDLP